MLLYQIHLGGGEGHPIVVADMQIYKRLCSSVRWSVSLLVRRSVEVIKLKSGKMSVLDTVYVCLEFGVWMGVGCPCPPVRNDIVTPRHLLLIFTTIIGGSSEGRYSVT